MPSTVKMNAAINVYCSIYFTCADGLILLTDGQTNKLLLALSPSVKCQQHSVTVSAAVSSARRF